MGVASGQTHLTLELQIDRNTRHHRGFFCEPKKKLYLHNAFPLQYVSPQPWRLRRSLGLACMSPRTLEEWAGQEHLLGEGKLLRRAVEVDRLSSAIFFGPPGCGKSALARLIAKKTQSTVEEMNAVTAGVADVRAIRS